MASLIRWKLPKSRSGRRPISVGKLLAREAEGKVFHKHADAIAGGLADDKNPTDFSRAALAKGVKVEREHTDSDSIAQEIAMDHLTEDTNYYDKLEKVEKKAFKLDGETTFQGLDIAIENGVGSTRKGENADGSKWSIKYKTPYGYIRGTTGADGEEVDCYVGPKRDADTAFVVHQKKDDGSYDEDTVMLGYDDKESAKADILRHYSDPKYVGSVSPVPMERLHALIELGKKLTKISTVARPTHDLDFVNNDFGETGIPAKLPRRRLELPSRDDVENSPRSTVEQRHDSRGTIVVGELGTPGAFNDVGKSAAVNKISKAMETLGQLSRSWEVPTDSAPASSADNSAESVDHHGPFGVTLSDIGPQAGDEWEGTGQASEMATRITKNASAFYGGLVEELGRLNAVTQGQLAKVAEVTREQAQVALEKLDELEHQKPTVGQLSRGAAVGSVVGPVASNVNKLIAHGEFHSPREMLGQIAGGAIFGIATPMLKHKVETGTERKVLKDYVGSGHGGRLATKIEDKLGTP